jgi:hypothetical protein
MRASVSARAGTFQAARSASVSSGETGQSAQAPSTYVDCVPYSCGSLRCAAECGRAWRRPATARCDHWGRAVPPSARAHAPARCQPPFHRAGRSSPRGSSRPRAELRRRRGSPARAAAAPDRAARRAPSRRRRRRRHGPPGRWRRARPARRGARPRGATGQARRQPGLGGVPCWHANIALAITSKKRRSAGTTSWLSHASPAPGPRANLTTARRAAPTPRGQARVLRVPVRADNSHGVASAAEIRPQPRKISPRLSSVSSR